MVAASGSRRKPIRIQLDNDIHAYAPGQQCSGRVLVPILQAAVDGGVRLSLVRRVRSVVSSANGQLESRFDNVRSFVEVADTFCEGHYVRQSGEIAYNFRLVVPTRRQESTPDTRLADDTASQVLSLEANIPSSANFSDSVLGRSWSARIEYVLEARLDCPDGQMNTVTVPITVQAGSLSPLLDLHDPSQRQTATEATSIRSWTLLPESQHSSTTLRQRTASLFRSSSLPMFTFEVEVSYPRTLQPGNPRPIPFTIGVSPVTSSNRTTIFPRAVSFYRYPSVTIESVKVDLHSTTTMHYPTLTKTASLAKLDQLTILYAQNVGHRLVVYSLASDQKMETHEESSSNVDIGKICHMSLPSSQTRRLDLGPAPTADGDTVDALDASFVSPTLSHTHALTWHITLICAGEKREIRSRTPQPIQVVDGPLQGTETVSSGPAPAYSKYARPTGALEATEDEHVSTRSREGRTASASVQHIMQVSKAAAEAALCELPSYSETANESSAVILQRGTPKVPSERREKTPNILKR